MKTAGWLYFFLFIAFFDLHAQYPILTPFAVSLGASPSFIGLVMGIYALTHLPGNLIASFLVDRHGCRLYITLSLICAGILLIVQSQVNNPWQLLSVRAFSGFVLAFLSPACMSFLARLSQDHVQQGKLMAGNGLVHTFASVISPAIGAYMAAMLGFTQSFFVLGFALLGIGICSSHFLQEPHFASVHPLSVEKKSSLNHNQKNPENKSILPWPVFLLPMSTSCAQGVLSFEIPLSYRSIINAGFLFSMISLGSVVTLSLLFLNYYLPYYRSLVGVIVLVICYFALAIGWNIPVIILFVIIGMAKGILFPAMTSLLLQLSGVHRYGHTFSLFAIALSVGAFIGPLVAGACRAYFSPYFISFFFLMVSLIFLYPRPDFKMNWN